MSNPHLIKNLTWEKANELIAAHTEEIVSPELCPNPLVSVMVHTYQHAKFIRECMNGILMQKTTFPFEIVVGDDGSTDGAYEILLDYQKQHPDKIRLFHSTPNLGRYTGNGILNGVRSRRACRGKYIAFVEGDDYWTATDKLERQVTFLEANPEYSASIHDVHVIGDTNGSSYMHDYGLKLRIHFDDQLTEAMPLAFGSMVGKLDLLRNFPEAYLNFTYGDRFFLSVFTAAGPVHRIPETMGVYRRHAGGITVSRDFYNFPTLKRNWLMFAFLKRYFHPHGKEYFSVQMRQCVRVMLRQSRRPVPSVRKMLTCLWLLLRMGPSQWPPLVREILANRSNASS